MNTQDLRERVQRAVANKQPCIYMNGGGWITVEQASALADLIDGASDELWAEGGLMVGWGDQWLALLDAFDVKP